MKKTKLISMVALLLTAVLLLASCGAMTFEDMVDRDYSPVDSYPAYTTMLAVTDLAGMSAGSRAGDLQLFSKQDALTGLDRYLVYDLANGAVAWSDGETSEISDTAVKTVSYDIDIATLKEVSYFTVTKTTTVVTSATAEVDVTERVSIWGWNGTAYAEIAAVDDPRSTLVTTQDLICFEGKVYRVDKETGVIAYAFDHSMLSSFPTLDYSTPEYYVDKVGNTWISYDKELQALSSFVIPDYAEVEYVKVIGDNIFLQYYVEQDFFGDEYTVILNGGQKYTLYTVLVDIETGEAENLECEYLVTKTFMSSTSKRWTKDYGLAEVDDEVALVLVSAFENKRIDTTEQAAKWALLEDNGDITLLELPTAVQIVNFTFLVKDRWLVNTLDGHTYLINGEGEILSEIDTMKVENGTMDYIAINGKLYDYDLNEIFDYQANKLTIRRATSKAILFNNEDGELLLYTNGQQSTLINKDSLLTRTYSTLYSNVENGYFVIVDTADAANTKYEIYNAAGTLINTFDQTVIFDIVHIADAKEGTVQLLSITTQAIGESAPVANYYRVS